MRHLRRITRAQEWYSTLDERVTAVVRQLGEKVLAFSEQLAEAAKKLKAREDDCDSLRAAGSRLQARTGQLEARARYLDRAAEAHRFGEGRISGEICGEKVQGDA